MRNPLFLSLLSTLAAGCLFVASADAATAPTWTQSLTIGQWYEVSGPSPDIGSPTNVGDDVDPEDDPSTNPSYPDGAPWRGNTGQRSVWATWNGAAFATGYGTNGGMILWGGGHGDYHGPEVYAFDMASRTWKRLVDPNPSNNYSRSTDLGDGLYGDDSPAPPHTYHSVQYLPDTNEFLTLKRQKVVGSGMAPDNVIAPSAFKLDPPFSASSWTNGRVNNVFGDYTPTFHKMSAYDSRRGLIWYLKYKNGFEWASYDRSSDNWNTYGSWSTSYSTGKYGGSGATYVGPLDIVVGMDADGDVFALDPATPNSGPVNISQSNRPSAAEGGSIEWSDVLAGIVWIRNGSSKVYVLRPPTLTKADSAWKSSAWSWSTVTAASNSRTPSASSNALYSKGRLAKYADAELIVYSPGSDDGVWVMKLGDQEPEDVPRSPRLFE